MEWEKKSTRKHSLTCSIAPLRKDEEEQFLEDLKIFFMKKGYEVVNEHRHDKSGAYYLRFLKEKEPEVKPMNKVDDDEEEYDSDELKKLIEEFDSQGKK